MISYIFLGVLVFVIAFFIFSFLRGIYYAYKIYKKTGLTDWNKIKKEEEKIL